MLNIIFCFTVFIVIGWMIMSDQIMDGIIVKAGLICVSLGFFGCAAILHDQRTDLLPGVQLIGLGILICSLGVYVRARMTGGKCNRGSDWIKTNE